MVSTMQNWIFIFKVLLSKTAVPSTTKELKNFEASSKEKLIEKKRGIILFADTQSAKNISMKTSKQYHFLPLRYITIGKYK